MRKAPPNLVIISFQEQTFLILCLSLGLGLGFLANNFFFLQIVKGSKAQFGFLVNYWGGGGRGEEETLCLIFFI